MRVRCDADLRREVLEAVLFGIEPLQRAELPDLGRQGLRNQTFVNISPRFISHNSLKIWCSMLPHSIQHSKKNGEYGAKWGVAGV